MHSNSLLRLLFHGPGERDHWKRMKVSLYGDSVWGLSCLHGWCSRDAVDYQRLEWGILKYQKHVNFSFHIVVSFSPPTKVPELSQVPCCVLPESHQRPLAAFPKLLAKWPQQRWTHSVCPGHCNTILPVEQFVNNSYFSPFWKLGIWTQPTWKFVSGRICFLIPSWYSPGGSRKVWFLHSGGYPLSLPSQQCSHHFPRSPPLGWGVNHWVILGRDKRADRVLMSRSGGWRASGLEGWLPPAAACWAALPRKPQPVTCSQRTLLPTPE